MMSNLMLLAALALAQDAEVDNPVSFSAVASHTKVKAGGEYHAVVIIDIVKPFHIYSANDQQHVIKTSVKGISTEGITFADAVFPRPKLYKYSIGDFELYEGRVKVIVPFRVLPDARSGSGLDLNFEVTYQACTEESCMPDETVTVNAGTITIAGEEEQDPAFAAYTEDVKNLAAGAGGKETPSNGDNTGSSASVDSTSLIIKYVAGIGIAFTPCVFPLFPITLSFFASQSGGKKSRKLILALLYVLGLSLTFAILGVVAALAGESIGAFIALPYVMIPLTLILIALGYSMIGLYEITVPSFIMDKVGEAKSGYIGAFIMGALFSVIAAPCVGPLIIQMLTEIALTRNVVYGAFSLFVFALGISTIMFVVAMFGSAMPRSGPFMYVVKLVLGVVIVLYSLYLLRAFVDYGMLALALGLFAISVGFITSREFDKLFGKRLVGGVSGLLSYSVAGFFLLGLFLPSGDPAGPKAIRVFLEGESQNEWYKSEEKALAIASREGRPVLVDFSASWCVPCQSLQKDILNNPAAASDLSRFVLLKMDVSNKESDNWKRMKERYKVLGPPAILFYDSKGLLVETPRFDGYNFTLEDFKRALELVR